MRSRIEDFLDMIEPRGYNAVETRRQIQHFVCSDPALEWALEPPEAPTLCERFRFWTPPVSAIAVVVGLMIWLCARHSWIGLLVLAAIGVLYLVLWLKEMTDPSTVTAPEFSHVQKLTQREDRCPQNHLTTITDLKPGPFRFTLLKGVLTFINVAARYIANKGTLAGIPSIHFARWAVVNRGKQLLFLSNFDGSWEHYLGEFIDLAANGLTAVWSNVVNFPKTRNLICEGARDEQKFKAFARNSEVHTQLWYSAYPFLSVTNILNNAAIRTSLLGTMDNEEKLEAWLRRF